MDRDQTRPPDPISALLRDRTRTALGVILACVALFAVADAGIDRAVVVPVYATKAALAAFLLAMLWALRGPVHPRRTLPIAFTTMNVTYVLFLVGDVLKGHHETTPQLAVVVAMSAAAVLPWDVRPQVATAVLIEIGSLGALALSGRPLEALIDPAASVTAALGVSIYVAFEFARFRRDRFRAEASLAERARFESLRADVRAAAMEPGHLSRVLGAAAEALVHHLGVARACVWTASADGTALDLQASAGDAGDVRGRVPLGTGAVGLIARERLPRTDRDAAGALAGHPLLANDRLLGVVAIYDRAPLAASACAALAAVADAIALAIARAHAEAARTRLLEELEHANRLKMEFVSTMSHELRTPLNVISGYLDMLEDPHGPDPALAFTRIRTANRELLELIEATLDLNRLDAGEDRFTIEECRLDHLWHDLAAELGTLPQAAEVELSWQVAPRTLLRTDRRKLKTIVKNLVGNALKFSPGGRVAVAAALGAEGCAITVRDTGIGIPAEHLPHVFEMFRQVDSTDRRAYGGVGLGLHIVQRLVTQLGGQIDVESRPGHGSTFTVRLPCAAEGAAALTGTAA